MLSDKTRHILNRIADILAYPVRTNLWFFLFALVVNEVLIIVSTIYDCGHDIFLSNLFMVLDCYLICVLAALLKKVYLFWLPELLYGALLLGEIFCVLIYHAEYSIRVLGLVLHTTSKAEFVGNSLLSWQPWTTFALVGLSAWLAVILMRRLRNSQPLTRSIWTWVLVVLVFWSATRQVPQYVKMGRCWQADTAAHLGDSRHRPDFYTSSMRFLYGLVFNVATSRELVMLVDTVRQTTVDSCSFRCPHIVLIIGESYNKHHTPLYNPEALPVSPCLSRLRDDGYLFLHQDAITSANLTSTVMQNMLTTWDDQMDDFYTAHSLFPAVFRQAGYEVYYISNQYVTKQVEEGSLWEQIGGTLFNNPELSRLQYSYRNAETYPDDGTLVDILPSQDSLTGRPALTIVHLRGQHVQYEYRYPEQYERFTEDDVNTPYGGKRGKKVTAQYANATLYNDTIVARIWNRFKDEDAIAIYLSDHGEEVYDWRNFFERSDVDEMNPNIARYQFEIPMMFILSDSCMAKHPDVVQQVQGCLNKPFINSDICHLLFGLAGIQSKEYKPSFDLLSEQYDVHRPRLIGTGVDYDELMKNN